MTDTPGTTRYALSFSTGALLAREALVAAPLYLETQDWGKVRARIDASNLLQARTVAAGRRLTREVVQRLEVLTTEELELLVEATATERGHLLWVAACRRYALIGEFAEEVLRERFLLLTPRLQPTDFDSFVRGKGLWNEEIAGLQESTLRKLRANLFQMMREAGLLDQRGEIAPAMVTQRVTHALSAHGSSDLRFFPMVRTA